MGPPQGHPRAERIGHIVFRVRDALAPAALVAVVALSRREDLVVPPALDGWLDAIGLGAVILGLGLRFWVMATSSVRRSGVRRRVVAPTLYADGVYAWCRNPLYVGNAVILIGLATLFDSRWMTFGALPIALVAIGSIVAAEERVLTRSFGERYREYCATVPRFLPRHWPRVTASAIDWRRGLRKEHGTIFAAAWAAIVLFLVEHHLRFGTFGRHCGPLLVAAWLGLATAWLVLRGLKRHRRLSDRVGPAALPPSVVRNVA
jgi:protein-S-isoprenylcysteine O-methyltransferase Ste14